jgi:hypothetical protein
VTLTGHIAASSYLEHLLDLHFNLLSNNVEFLLQRHHNVYYNGSFFFCPHLVILLTSFLV